MVFFFKITKLAQWAAPAVITADTLEEAEKQLLATLPDIFRDSKLEYITENTTDLITWWEES